MKKIYIVVLEVKTDLGNRYLYLRDEMPPKPNYTHTVAKITDLISTFIKDVGELEIWVPRLKNAAHLNEIQAILLTKFLNEKLAYTNLINPHVTHGCKYFSLEDWEKTGLNQREG